MTPREWTYLGGVTLAGLVLLVLLRFPLGLVEEQLTHAENV